MINTKYAALLSTIAGAASLHPNKTTGKALQTLVRRELRGLEAAATNTAIHRNLKQIAA